MVQEAPSTVLIVHGSWHQPQHYEPLIDAFKRQGIEAICPRLPSFAAAPGIGLREDVQHIQTVIENLLAGGRDFIVLAHSYGGVVSCEALGAHYAKRVRVMSGQNGGLCGIVFMSAFLPLPGQSLADALGGALPPFIPVDAKGMCVMLDPPQAFYHDLPADQAAHWTSLLAPCPAITQFARTTNVSYLHHPSMYIYGEHDQRLVYPIQQWMVKRAKALGATFKEKALQSSHSPFLSMPDSVVGLIKTECLGGFFSVTEDFEQKSGSLRNEFQEMMSRMGPPPDQAT